MKKKYLTGFVAALLLVCLIALMEFACCPPVCGDHVAGFLPSLRVVDETGQSIPEASVYWELWTEEGLLESVTVSNPLWDIGDGYYTQEILTAEAYVCRQFAWQPGPDLDPPPRVLNAVVRVEGHLPTEGVSVAIDESMLDPALQGSSLLFWLNLGDIVVTTGAES